MYCLFIQSSSSNLYSLSLHDALPICAIVGPVDQPWAYDWYELTTSPDSRIDSQNVLCGPCGLFSICPHCRSIRFTDRKSTRLNSSHVAISYAVFCLKKKNNKVNK